VKRILIMRDISSAGRRITALLGSVDEPASAPTALATVARSATAVWLVLSAINLVIWVLVGAIGGTFGSPWWLWAFAGGGAIVGGLDLAARSYQPARRPATVDRGRPDTDSGDW
jgi:hypothetical protein